MRFGTQPVTIATHVPCSQAGFPDDDGNDDGNDDKGGASNGVPYSSADAEGGGGGGEIGYAGGGIGGGGGIALSQMQQQYDAQMGYILNILPEWILTKPVDPSSIFNNTQQQQQQQINPFYYAADFSVPKQP